MGTFLGTMFYSVHFYVEAAGSLHLGIFESPTGGQSQSVAVSRGQSRSVAVSRGGAVNTCLLYLRVPERLYGRSVAVSRGQSRSVAVSRGGAVNTYLLYLRVPERLQSGLLRRVQLKLAVLQPLYVRHVTVLLHQGLQLATHSATW